MVSIRRFGEYRKPVCRPAPGCVLFLVDQSATMTEMFAGTLQPKINIAANILNKSLEAVVLSCERGSEQPHYFFDIAVIGYKTSQDNVPHVGPILHGAVTGRDLVSVVELSESVIGVETGRRDDGAGGIREFTYPIWYRPQVNDLTGRAPICEAMDYYRRIASNWCIEHRHSFPPVVFHITGGGFSDSPLEQSAERLRAIGTDDGNLLLFHCLITGSEQEPVPRALEEHQLADEPARRLFRTCSLFPDSLQDFAKRGSNSGEYQTRGMIINSNLIAIVCLWLRWALQHTE